jgi:hypothetical protein
MKKESLKINEEFKFSMKYYYSYSFYQAAALFSREAFRQKLKLDNKKMDRDYRSNVLGSIIFSVTFLESTINEFYDKVISDIGKTINESNPDYRLYKKLSFLWNNDKIRNVNILDKYQLALSTFEKEIFEIGSNPFQDIQALIYFRNYLIHYKPETVSFSSENEILGYESNVEKKIHGRLKVSDYWISLDHSFPGKYLGAESAEWSLIKVKLFVKEFYQRIGFHYIYKNLLDQIEIN